MNNQNNPFSNQANSSYQTTESNNNNSNADSLKQKPPSPTQQGHTSMTFNNPICTQAPLPQTAETQQNFNDQQKAFIQSGIQQQPNISNMYSSANFTNIPQLQTPMWQAPSQISPLQYPYQSQTQQQMPYNQLYANNPYNQPSYAQYPPNNYYNNLSAPVYQPLTQSVFRSGPSSNSYTQPQLNLNYADDEPIEPKPLAKSHTTTNTDTQASKDLKDILELSMQIKQNTLQASSFSGQTLPFLVSLKVGSLKTDTKVPIDLVCVIDHSGSMSGEKIELVKNTFNYLLEYLDSYDRLSIIIFDHNASRLVPFLRTTQDNKTKILAALKSVFGKGSTNINLGMHHAFQALKQRRHSNPVSSIFLLSDGLDSGAQERVKASLTQLEIPEDITINTFGYGRDHDPQLMTDIANLRDGNFYFIDRLDTVDECFVDCLGGLINSVAQNTVIKIKPEQSNALNGVKIEKAYGDASMWNYDGQAYTTKMSTLMADKSKDYVLEITIPRTNVELQDHEKTITIANAEAVVTDLDGKQVVKKAELVVTLLNETEDSKAQEGDNKDVMKNYYRVKGAELLEEARKLADKRQYDEAKKILQGFKEQITNSFLKDEEFIRNMVKDFDKALTYVNPTVYQDYGRHTIVSNFRSQMQQRSDFSMSNNYQIPCQMAMTDQVRAMKSQSNQNGHF